MTEIANLRRARVRCHKQLKQTEALLAGYQAKLADIEARIFAIAPEIDLPFRFHKPNPVFARGEMTRLILTVLREADRPLTMREIAAAMMVRKGITELERRLIDHTHKRLSCALATMHKRGSVRMMSVRDRWRWVVW
jgi:hypothetical protein